MDKEARCPRCERAANHAWWQSIQAVVGAAVGVIAVVAAKIVSGGKDKGSS